MFTLSPSLRTRTLLGALALACAGAPALAQVSTITADGWRHSPALASRHEAPVARLYEGRVFVNAHPDTHPGLAHALERPNFTPDRGDPADFGAPASLGSASLYTAIGPTVVRVDPWTPIHGRGHLRTLEAERVAWLEKAGFTGGVRTHVNITIRTPAIEDGEAEPRGVIRVRPATPPAEPVERFVRRDHR